MSQKKIHKRYKRHTFRKKLTYGIIVLVCLALFSYYALTFRNSPQSVSERFELKAAIVDHLSLTVDENLTKTFKETATDILKQAEFKVDYYPGENVTVNFYRDLPLRNYQLIILRVHSTAGQRTEEGKLIPSFTVLFTSEPYDETRYSVEQDYGLLAKVYYTPYSEGDPAYFGITPGFVMARAYGMEGRFSDAIIILMGCEGLTNTETAQAFIQKGAKVYISWNTTVTASHTDNATIHLLRHLLLEKQTIKNSIENTMKEVGLDPYFNSQLIFYPPEAKNYLVQSFLSEVGSEIKSFKSRLKINLIAKTKQTLDNYWTLLKLKA